MQIAVSSRCILVVCSILAVLLFQYVIFRSKSNASNSILNRRAQYPAYAAYSKQPKTKSSISTPVKLYDCPVNTPQDKFFPYMPTGSQRVQMKKLFFVFHKAVEALELDYALGAGTLLGSIRHHCLVPWDDDLDISFFGDVRNQRKGRWKGKSVRQMLDAVIEKMGPPYKIVFFWKVYRIFDGSGSTIAGHIPMKWPFIDVVNSCTSADGNLCNKDHYDFHLTPETPEKTFCLFQQCAYTYNDFFPLTKRPFEGVWAPTPRNYTQYMYIESYREKRGTRLSTCCTQAMSHRCLCNRVKSKCETCSVLYAKYPYPNVERKVLNGKEFETLFVGRKKIYQVEIQK